MLITKDVILEEMKLYQKHIPVEITDMWLQSREGINTDVMIILHIEGQCYSTSKFHKTVEESCAHTIQELSRSYKGKKSYGVPYNVFDVLGHTLYKKLTN